MTTATTTQQGATKQAAPKPSTAIAVSEKNVCDHVLNRIKEFEAADALRIPKNYAVENALKAAWLVLQEVEDRQHNRALEVCTKESIANALLDMVIQGLSVSKKQCYFIVYGKKLLLQRSYFGTQTLAMRTGELEELPVANVIYEGDEFIYEIDPQTGLLRIVKHTQKLENIDPEKIKAAYAIVKLKGGKTQVTIMTMAQIKKAWAQGATKGGSPAHQNFTDEMAKKSVIGRALKAVINSSNDAWLYEDKPQEDDTDTVREERQAVIEQRNVREALPEPAEYVEIKEEAAPQPAPQAKQAAPTQQPATAPQAPQQQNGSLFPDDDPGY